MQPAFSVIFLTTLIGMGQGLFLAIYTRQVYSVLNVVQNTGTDIFYNVSNATSLGLLILGLIASMFHLGHPERAWRAAAMWRTSWLSREVIVLPIVMGLIFLYGLVHFTAWNPAITVIGAVVIDLSLIIGAMATLAVFSLYIATGMIYACLKFLQEWHTPLTVINYILLGTSSGFMLASLIAVWKQPDLLSFFSGWSIFLVVIAFIFRWTSLIRNKRLRPKSTVQTAIGIRHHQIKQKSMGFMGGSVNTRDFFHGKTLWFLRSIKNIFIIMVFVFPLIMLSIAFFKPSILLLGAAMFSMILGLIAERWYFFAEGNHPQNIYYQTIA
jgi:sulfite dehydrogenase (quinone) subunit SoeC